jgi:hypothetical protein
METQESSIMRVIALLLLVMATTDTTLVMMIIVPLAALLAGFGLGHRLSYYQCYLGFNEHLDKHATRGLGVSGCMFCRAERAPLLSEKPERKIYQ